MAKGEGQFWVATKEKAAKQIFGFIKRKKELRTYQKGGGLLLNY